jgi:isopentenyl-diphosphate delta-isomerase
MSKEYVILVDAQDQAIGIEEKIKAHQEAKRHRAFSIMLYRQGPDGIETLLQQRTTHKYHAGGLWSNSCCSHPRPDEPTLAAATRRLHEELGIHTPLQAIDAFEYIAHFDNGLTEHEYDHVLVGNAQGLEPTPNPNEVMACQWLDLNTLSHALETKPQRYTPWLAQVLACFQGWHLALHP